MSKFQPSPELLEKIKAFEEARESFAQGLAYFEQTHEAELVHLEKLRDDRNAKLDEAKRALRQETENLDDLRTQFTVGPFTVQKKWSEYYIPEKLVSMLGDCGLYDDAISSGVVAVRTEVAKYDQVHKYLEDHGIVKDFECCEDGMEAGTAISGPKTVPPFGAELKKE